MAKLRKTLPKDFEGTLKSGDLAAMQAVFEKCALDAHGGYSKQCALAFVHCPPQLARCLVEQGLDIDTPDQYDNSALQMLSGHYCGEIATLLDLGADIHRSTGHGTPLHRAAQVHNLGAARLLLQRGARPDARNAHGLTPLGLALQQCHNAKLASMAAMADLLLSAANDSANARPSLLSKLLGRKGRSEADDPALKAMVRKLGETFEFHRDSFNREGLQAAEAGLDRLYELFGVAPVPRRELAPMDQPIGTKASRWQDRHKELWQKLVPGSGAAPTVQGEVIRISRRIADELDGNGGINWDDQYRMMADAFAVHVASGTPLCEAELAEACALASEIKRKRGEPSRLAQLAVEWVEANPDPVALPKPDYDR